MSRVKGNLNRKSVERLSVVLFESMNVLKNTLTDTDVPEGAVWGALTPEVKEKINQCARRILDVYKFAPKTAAK